MNRVKVIAVVSLVLAASSLCHANIYVDWGASTGFFWDGSPNVGILGSGTGNSTIAQLIWSEDGIADPASASTTHYVTGDDVWLADITITEDGLDNDATGGGYDSYALFTAPTYNGADQGVAPDLGNVYARIFQDDVVEVGDWYYVSTFLDPPLASLDPDGEPPPAAQAIGMNRDLTNGDVIDGEFGAQVVPEPGSMALLLLGAAVVGVRRRRRK